MSEFTLEGVIKQIQNSLDYDIRMMDFYDEGTKDYLFHLGHVDAYTSIKYKLVEILKEKNNVS